MSCKLNARTLARILCETRWCCAVCSLAPLIFFFWFNFYSILARTRQLIGRRRPEYICLKGKKKSKIEKKIYSVIRRRIQIILFRTRIEKRGNKKIKIIPIYFSRGRGSSIKNDITLYYKNSLKNFHFFPNTNIDQHVLRRSVLNNVSQTWIHVKYRKIRTEFDSNRTDRQCNDDTLIVIYTKCFSIQSYARMYYSENLLKRKMWPNTLWRSNNRRLEKENVNYNILIYI